MRNILIIIFALMISGGCCKKEPERCPLVYDCTGADKKAMSEWTSTCWKEAPHDLARSHCPEQAERMFCKPVTADPAAGVSRSGLSAVHEDMPESTSVIGPSGKVNGGKKEQDTGNPFKFCYKGINDYELCVEDTLEGCMKPADGLDVNSKEFEKVYNKCYKYLADHEKAEGKRFNNNK